MFFRVTEAEFYANAKIMANLTPPSRLSGPETGYFQATDSAFLSLMVSDFEDSPTIKTENMFQIFNGMPFGVAISEKLCDDFIFVNKVLQQYTSTTEFEFLNKGNKVFFPKNNEQCAKLYKKIKTLVLQHKQKSHEPFGCMLRYGLPTNQKSIPVIHNISDFTTISGLHGFLHIFLPDPQVGKDAPEIYIPCRNFRWVLKNEEETVVSSLTNREQQIFNRITTGKTSIEIAEEFSLSVHTVKIHRKNILRKLKAKNSMDALQKMKLHAFL